MRTDIISVVASNGTGRVNTFDSSEDGFVYVSLYNAAGHGTSLTLTPEEALAFATRLLEAADEAVDASPEITD